MRCLPEDTARELEKLEHNAQQLHDTKGSENGTSAATIWREQSNDEGTIDR
jgi:hypothetical protein